MEDNPVDLPDEQPGPRTPETDSFRPPRNNCIVVCLHCRQQYDSYKMQWLEVPTKSGATEGFWFCGTPGCSGKGFNCDIFPIDPNWEDDEDRGFVGGWFDDDGNRVPPPMD